MRVLILANGAPPSRGLAQRLSADHDKLFAADGAALKARDLGLVPDVICGDFDSLSIDVARTEFNTSEVVVTPDQSLSDLEKAVRLAIDRSATTITLIGATGARLDHTLVSYAILIRYAPAVALQIVEEASVVRGLVATGGQAARCAIASRPGDTVSLVAFGRSATVSLQGVRWRMRGEQLAPGSRGVSNVAEADLVDVEVSSGAVLICHTAGLREDGAALRPSR